MDNGPTSQPSCAMLHGRDNTPDPITPVTMCATAVHTVPNHNTTYIMIYTSINFIINITRLFVRVSYVSCKSVKLVAPIYK